MQRAESIIITGGGGMLAAAFKETLAGTQREGVLLPRAEFDVTDAGQVARVFENHRPTVCINCAAYTKVDLAEKEVDRATAINGQALRTIAQACRRFDSTLVHFSTDYVFDGTLRRPLKPDDPVGPRSVYGQSKLLGEKLLIENAPPRWMILRTAWLYGPGGPCFPQAILNAARAGKPLKVIDDQIGCPTFTFDLASATLELLSRDAGGIWHIVNSGQTSWHGFATAVLDAFGVPAPIEPTTSGQWKQSRPDSAERPAYSVLDTAPFAALIGHAMPTWQDALKRYAAKIS